jgi:hypothetical protein
MLAVRLDEPLGTGISPSVNRSRVAIMSASTLASKPASICVARVISASLPNRRART